MKLKKWLYGLGGFTSIAVPSAVAVSCSCSSKSSTNQASSESKYVENKNTQTGTFTISGSRFVEYKNALNLVHDEGIRNEVKTKYLFGHFASDGAGQMFGLANELYSDLQIRNWNSPSLIPKIHKVEILEKKDSIIFNFTFDNTGRTNYKELLTESLEKIERSEFAESLKGEIPRVHDAFMKVWQVLKKSIMSAVK